MALYIEITRIDHIWHARGRGYDPRRSVSDVCARTAASRCRVVVVSDDEPAVAPTRAECVVLRLQWLFTSATSNSVPGGAPGPKGGGRPRSNRLLTNASSPPCLATVVGTRNNGDVITDVISPLARSRRRADCGENHVSYQSHRTRSSPSLRLRDRGDPRRAFLQPPFPPDESTYTRGVTPQTGPEASEPERVAVAGASGERPHSPAGAGRRRGRG
jgi:hypothetical protein